MTTPNPINPGGKMMSKIKLRGVIRGRAPEILDVLFTALQSSNPSLKLGAAKILINKILPDLKATELSGKGGQGIRVEFVDYDKHSDFPPAETEGSTKNE